MPTPHSNILDTQWRALLRAIRNDRCIICVGPEFYTPPPSDPASPPKPQGRRLSEHLLREADALGIQVNENGWYHLRNGGDDGGAVEAVRSFYEGEGTTRKKELKQLASIQTHFLLSLTPDNNLEKVFAEERYSVRTVPYVRNKHFQDIDPPTKENPVIYKLLGDVERRNSLVLTFDDFYSYIESVFKGNSMSPRTKEMIYESEFFLFLGMPRDDWRMHLFLRVLRQHVRGLQSKFATMPNHDDQTREAWNDQYDIRLINDNISAFLDQLVSRCEQEGLIRQATERAAADQLSPDELQELVEKNQSKKAADILTKMLKSVGPSAAGMFSELVIIKRDLGIVEEQNVAGALSLGEAMRAMAGINLRLSKLISRYATEFHR